MVKIAGGGAALVATLVLAHPQAPSRPAADLVLTNGKVLTVDANDSVVQAIAVANGTIIAAGSAADVGAFIGPRTRVVDLRGRAVTPGLIDSHVHFS